MEVKKAKGYRRAFRKNDWVQGIFVTQGMGCCFTQGHVHASMTVIDQGEH